MLKLENVTLIGFTSVNIEGHIKALEYSSKDIEFGMIKLVSDIKPNNLPDNIIYEYTNKMSNIDEWNYSTIYELPKHIDTEFCILIHDDGFIVNVDSWRDEFLKYDYIGAPWGLPNDNFSFRDINNEVIRVGNSVSLRSKKLLQLAIDLPIEWKSFHGYYNEDGFICVNNRHIYKKNGCKFGDINIAKYFSHETMIPEIEGIKPFAFHRYNGNNIIYPKYKK